MALYSYLALSKEGKKVRGQLDASSPQAVREGLMKTNLYPVTIELAGNGTASGQGWGSWESWQTFFTSRKVEAKDKVFFTKQLALLLKSGVPLLQALELLIEQSEGYLKVIVTSLKNDIKEGKPLADSLERYPAVFDSTYVQLVRAGEASGKLDVILNRLTTYLERSQEVTRRVKKALSYPLMQLGFIAVIVGVLLYFVVPSIADTLTSEGMELPWPTRFLLGLSSLLTNYYLLLAIVIGAIYMLYRWWSRTPQGKRTLDILKLKLPIVRYFSRMGTVVQFSRTLGMLIESGVNLAEALFIVGKIVDNQILAEALNEARDNIIKQGRIAEYLKKTNIFPAVAIFLINTGEQSGQLGPMLLTVSEYYEVELTDLADSLSNKLGPIMTVLMGLIVGFIILSIIWPIMQAGLLNENI